MEKCKILSHTNLLSSRTKPFFQNHLIYIYRVLTLSLFFTLCSSHISLAEWPTEPMVGIELIDYGVDTPDREHLHLYRGLTLSDGSLAVIMVRDDTDDMTGDQIAVRIIRPDGTLVVPSDDYETGIIDARFNWILESNDWSMAYSEGFDGSLFLLWEDTREGSWDWQFGYWETDDVKAQKISSEGEVLWNPQGIKCREDRESDYSNPYYIVPQLDGGAMAVISRNLAVQLIDEDGNKMWGNNGVSLIENMFLVTVAPSQYEKPIFDGYGGVLFSSIMGITYILSTGELAWSPVDLPGDSVKVRKLWQCSNDDKYLSGYHGISVPNYIPYMSRYSYSDTINIEEYVNQDYYWLKSENCGNSSFGGWREQNNDNIFFYNRFDLDFNPLLPEDGIRIDFSDRYVETAQFFRYYRIGLGGARLVCRSGDVPWPESTNFLRKFDVNGEFDWEVPIFESQGVITEWMVFEVDSLGNTWVMWSEYDNNDEILSTFVNVISPEGEWGQPVVNSVSEENSELNLPELLTVSAYPNPFNASTNITINLQSSERVSVQIFDMLGRNVTSLLENESLTSGNHSIIWNTNGEGANALASGVYFVRATTESGHKFTTRVQHLK